MQQSADYFASYLDYADEPYRYEGERRSANEPRCFTAKSGAKTKNLS